MGIERMVDYTRGSHNVYKERYTDPAQWQKEFDADIRFWLKFNTDWYESVILSKDHMTVDMKSINWDLLRSLDIPTVNDAIDICHAKGMTNVMAINYDWNEEVVAQFYANLYIHVRQGHFIGSFKASPCPSPMRDLLKSLTLVRRTLVAPSFMVGSFRLTVRWLSCTIPYMERWSLAPRMG
jgi:hypothetical protein